MTQDQFIKEYRKIKGFSNRFHYINTIIGGYRALDYALHHAGKIMRDLSPEERATLKAYKGEISSDVIKADLGIMIGSPVSGTINANDIIEIRIGDKIVYKAICK